VIPAERRKKLLKFAELLEENTEHLSYLSRLTLGSPFEAFGKFESGMCSESFRYYAGWVDKVAGQSFPQEDGFMKIVRNEPLGVTAGICPWNGPLASIGQKAAPALAAGNCFILKPSEKTPLAALALGELAKQAGFPPGVFQVLTGDGSTGALLANHMRIRAVSFTGSIPTGKKILEMAAKSNLKRVSLELGGKSPAVVFDDCNLENAATWCANALATHSGQVCIAATLVYVQEGIYPKFIEAYKAKLLEKTKSMGDPEDPATQVGPLVDEAQFDRVSGFIERGHEQGKVLIGGKRVGDKVRIFNFVSGGADEC
jgi:aldehyde dehydrogenase (NAD+)